MSILDKPYKDRHDSDLSIGAIYKFTWWYSTAIIEYDEYIWGHLTEGKWKIVCNIICIYILVLLVQLKY